jgi:hypothetical protein
MYIKCQQISTRKGSDVNNMAYYYQLVTNDFSTNAPRQHLDHEFMVDLKLV